MARTFCKDGRWFGGRVERYGLELRYCERRGVARGASVDM